MRPNDLVTDVVTTALRTVLPQRGAIANAREALLRDRSAAEQRREAASLAARVAGQPPAAPGEVPDPTGTAVPVRGLPLSLEQRARLADVAPLPGFAAAAETALDLLHGLAGMDLWLVTAVQDGLERVVAARGAAGMPVPPGAVHPWAESYCRLMVAGQGPRVAPRTREIPAYAASPATRRWGIAAYIGVPLLASDGSLFGVLCGLSRTEKDDSLLDALPEVERTAKLLSTLLAKELAALERSQAAAQAYALADRDPLTGLLNRRGWQARLQDEEERRRRRGHGSTVVLVRAEVGRVGLDQPDDSGDGDDLLRDVARVLADACRSADSVARLGDHDFAVLAVDCDAAEAARLVRRLRDAFCHSGVRVTVGVASGARHQDLFEAWRRADEQVHDVRRAAAHGPGRPAPDPDDS
jgi:diguanylate cyclase